MSRATEQRKGSGRRFVRPLKPGGRTDVCMERLWGDLLRFMDEAERELARMDAKIKKLEEEIHATAQSE